jgi:hypothetical protein
MIFVEVVMLIVDGKCYNWPNISMGIDSPVQHWREVADSWISKCSCGGASVASTKFHDKSSPHLKGD